MPLTSPRSPRRPTSRSASFLRRWRAPLIALAPLGVGFFGALAADRLGAPPSQPSDLAPTVQLTSAPQAPVSDATPVSPVSPASPTREPELEARLERTLVEGRTPYAATVLLEIGTGRVLAVAEHSTRGPSDGLALRPMAPAASVFKLVTTAALLESGVRPDEKVCTHGGKTRMSAKLLVDNGRRDAQCAVLADAVPRSLNVAIAKLALKHLDPDRLRTEAAEWGFGTSLVQGAASSSAAIPDDPFTFAEAAAGFGDVKISALHGAMIAAAAVQDGLLVPPRFDDAADAPAPTRATSPEAARALRRMMVETVTDGTGRKAFAAAPRLNASAGGKTGSLTDYSTGLETTWFVGFAPADRPAVAVASVVVNTAKWHVRAPTVAKEALRAYFASHPTEKTQGLVARR